jgi:hypothetical protein
LRNRFLEPEWVFIFGMGPTIEADAFAAYRQQICKGREKVR